MARLETGDPFPTLTVHSTDGPVELEDRWREGPLVVAFMRHFGWPFCREHLAQLDQARDEIRAAGGDVVSVFQYRAEPTRNFCRRRQVSFECLGDPRREAYAAVGLERASFGEYAGPQMAKRFIGAATSGHVVGDPKGGDVAQRPGTFVVGSDGRVRLAHYNRDSSDNPRTDAVLAAVREAAGA